MIDQATELRRLAACTDSFTPLPPTSKRQPHVIAVVGGKGGVGTTTIAIGLAAAMASEDQETLLADGNFSNPDIATACGLAVGQRNSGGAFGVLPWGPAGMYVASHAASQASSLIQQINTAALDLVVIDAGSGLNRAVRELWHSADQVLLVTGEEAISAMDSYAAIKIMARDCPQPISTLINGTQSAEIATEIHARIAGAARRFLGRDLEAGGYIPRDPTLARRAANLRSGWPAASINNAVLRFRQLATHVTRVASDTRRHTTYPQQLNHYYPTAAVA